MKTWYDYRTVWSRTPWMLALALAGVLLVIAGILGSLGKTNAALFFIPGLAVLFGHHLLVAKRL